jgi:hypothetical protein
VTNLEEMIVTVIKLVLVCFETVVVPAPIPVSSVEQGTVV